MEGEIELKNDNNPEIKNQEINNELNLNEELNITCDQDKNKIIANNNINIEFEKEKNEVKEAEMDFEQIKKNHMQMMNNINNMSAFGGDSSSNYNRLPDYLQHKQQNQSNNSPYNYNNNVNGVGLNNRNVGFQGITMPHLPNPAINMMTMSVQATANMPFAPQNAFIPAPPRILPPNQMLMQNQSFFFDCNPFALFMQRKFSLERNTSSNINNMNKKIKLDENEEKPFFFSFSNTLLANTPNKDQDESNKGIDLTKMIRFNVKFINPFNGSKPNLKFFYNH